MSQIILPKDSEIYQTFQEIVNKRRVAFLVGLPGTGKSLYVKQMALMAQAAGRTVHMLQYDVARLAFETPENLGKYPEIDGFTHAALRKAVGLWTRQAVLQWAEKFTASEHFLLGEFPLVGNRLSELVALLDDAAEPLLASDGTIYVLPVPSARIREMIETARAKSIARPKHKKEEKDAQPNVLVAMWEDTYNLAHQIGMVEAVPEGKTEYDPMVYTAVYEHFLRHRHAVTLQIDEAFKPQGSAYDLAINGTELAAPPEEVAQIMAHIEQTYTPESLEEAVARWYDV